MLSQASQQLFVLLQNCLLQRCTGLCCLTLHHWMLLQVVRQGPPALKDVPVIPEHHLRIMHVLYKGVIACMFARQESLLRTTVSTPGVHTHA